MEVPRKFLEAPKELQGSYEESSEVFRSSWSHKQAEINPNRIKIKPNPAKSNQNRIEIKPNQIKIKSN